MEEIARVVKVDGENVIVEISSASHCKSCNLCTTLSGDETIKTLTVSNTLSAKVNDVVKLGITQSRSILVSFIVYLFPLLMTIAGYFIGSEIDTSERTPRGDSILAIGFSMLFLILSFLIVFFLDKAWSKKKEFNPQLLEFYKTDQEPAQNDHC